MRDGKAAAKDGSYAAGPSPRRIAFVTGVRAQCGKLPKPWKCSNAERPRKNCRRTSLLIRPEKRLRQRVERSALIRPHGRSLREAGAARSWLQPRNHRAARLYSDPVAENAVIGTITTGLFAKIPSEKLIPANAFTDEKCRIIYAAAPSLRHAGAIVTSRAVNEVLERSGASKRLNKLLDAYNLSPESWKLWDHEVDRSLACAATTLPVEDSLAHLKALYTNREDLLIGERLSDGTLSGEQAIAALAALRQSDAQRRTVHVHSEPDFLHGTTTRRTSSWQMATSRKGADASFAARPALARADSFCN
ncbi:unnamed protein product [uncultured bacterium]|nr:unnamed protein product [uncultured bacterium]